ncbi:hypothetical protein B0H13DRAFT_884767 [Mycena leptocephala]|nr:hypothetical protein B0H13DRAFT_884767 [Mycena leptocephala]
MHCRLLPSAQTLHRANASPLERRVPTNAPAPSDRDSNLDPYPLPSTILSASMAPPQGSRGGAGVIQVVHTDDAATKLSDRVRRRCFNCCMTYTSTWIRSNLSPGTFSTTNAASSNARTRVHTPAVPAPARTACALESPLALAPRRHRWFLPLIFYSFFLERSTQFPFWEIVATLFRCRPFLLHLFVPPSFFDPRITSPLRFQRRHH